MATPDVLFPITLPASSAGRKVIGHLRIIGNDDLRASSHGFTASGAVGHLTSVRAVAGVITFPDVTPNILVTEPTGSVYELVIEYWDGTTDTPEYATVANVTGPVTWGDANCPLTEAPASLTSPPLARHLADTTDAHDASAISVVPFGTIAATDVQAALEEIKNEATGAVTSVNARTGTVTGLAEASDVTAEASARAAADTTLTNSITTEATTRGNADTALGANTAVVLVDGTAGSDATGTRGRLDKPFATISGAKAVALAGDHILIRAGTYTESTTVTVLDGQKWQGLGLVTINYSATSGALFSAQDVSNFEIRDLTLVNTGATGSAIGVLIHCTTAMKHWRLHNLFASAWKGHGFKMTATSAGNLEHYNRGRYSQLSASGCVVGMLIDDYHEYSLITDLNVGNCNTGVIINSGNTDFIGTKADDCVIGIDIGTGNNDGKLKFIGGSANHCATYGVRVTGLTNGVNFVGFNVQSSNILLSGCAGVKFQAGQIGTSTITASGTLGVGNLFHGVYTGVGATATLVATELQRAKIQVVDCVDANSSTGWWVENDPTNVLAISTLPHVGTTVGMYGMAPAVLQRPTYGNVNGAIAGLTISAAYSQAEVQALRDACETLADDVRALRTALGTPGYIHEPHTLDGLFTSFWRFERNAKDYYGLNDLTPNAGVVWGTGKTGVSCPTFTVAADTKLSVAHNSTQNATALFSAGAWIKVTSATQTNPQTIIAKWSQSSPLAKQWRIQVDATGKLTAVLTTDGSTTSTVTYGGLTLSAATWYHVVWVYDGTQGTAANRWRLYLNGSVIATGSMTYTGATLPATIYTGATSALSIGTLTNISHPFDGSIDSAFYSNSIALSAAQVTALYNGGTSLEPPTFY